MRGRRRSPGVVLLAVGVCLALVDVAASPVAASGATALAASAQPDWSDVVYGVETVPEYEVTLGETVEIHVVTRSCDDMPEANDSVLLVAYAEIAFPLNVEVTDGDLVAVFPYGSGTGTATYTPDRRGQYQFLMFCGDDRSLPVNTYVDVLGESEPTEPPEPPEPPPPPPPPPRENRPPVAVADAYTVAVGGTLRLGRPGILRNDSDPDGDPIRAVYVGHVSGLAAQLQFRADGDLTLTPVAGESGVVCIEYLARDSHGALSTTVGTVVVTVGDVDAGNALTGEGTCDGAIRRDRHEYEVTVEEVELDIPLGEDEGEGSAAGVTVWAAAPFGGGLPEVTELDEFDEFDGEFGPVEEYASGMFDEAGPLAWDASPGLAQTRPRWQSVMWPRKTAVCNQHIARTGVTAFYGSMTVYGTARRGAADYVSVRASFFQSGQRVHTTRWTKPPVVTGFGENAWSRARMHMRFGAPGETYSVTWQVRWMQNRVLRPDRVIAQTAFRAFPYSCTSGGGM